MSTSAPTDENPSERVGNAVADRRIEVGFESQRELAEAAGVGLNTAALLERGKSWPQVVNRTKLEDALQWPRGTLDALRRGQPIPQSAPRPVVPPPAPVAAPTDPRTNVQALHIATAVAAIAATCTQILVRHNNDPTAKAALHDLEDQLLHLESLIAASLPHVAGTSFSDTMSALTQLHEYRDIIRDAAASPDDSATQPAGAPRRRMASARS